jgi:hypothetical protein
MKALDSEFGDEYGGKDKLIEKPFTPEVHQKLNEFHKKVKDKRSKQKEESSS